MIDEAEKNLTVCLGINILDLFFFKLIYNFVFITAI